MTEDYSEEAPRSEEQALAHEAEVERLQAEVAALQQQVADHQDAADRPRHTWRRVLVVLLIVLGSIVAIGANAALWVRDVVLDTDEWVATVGPLSQNEVIMRTVSGYVVSEVFARVDVEQVAVEVLPDEVDFLSKPLTEALQDVVADLVSDVMQSDQFNAVWVTANRAAHQLIIGALRSDGDYLYLKGGQLTLDLEKPFEFIQDTLGLGELDLFAGKDWGKYVLLESHQVAMLQQALSLLNAVGILLPFVALILYFLAWLVSLWRRQTILWIGVGLAVSMAVLLLVLALAQPMILSAFLDPIMRAVVGEIWKVVTNGLVWRTIFVLVVGVLVAIGAALAGPHPQAVALRSGVSERLGRSKE